MSLKLVVCNRPDAGFAVRRLPSQIVGSQIERGPYASEEVGRVIPLTRAAVSNKIAMVDIPEGEFLYQNRNAYLPAFKIGKFPVINREYGEFMEETGHTQPQLWEDKIFGIEAKDGSGNLIGPDLPVVGVNWQDIQAFLEWSGTRLPSEVEWEKAARGPIGRIYPWGNKFELGRTVSYTNRTRPVNRKGIELGASPYGVLDMVGNVLELTSSYMSFSSRNRRGSDESGENRVLRGGAWSFRIMERLRCDSRFPFRPGNSLSGTGFRVAGG